MHRRVFPATSRGRTRASIALACSAVMWRSAWPGRSSARKVTKPASKAWTRQTVWTLRQSLATVGEHPQNLERGVDLQHPQVRGAHGDHCHGVGVQGVDLPVVAGVEQPDPGRELGRDIHNVFAGLEQPLS
jgi:hypothetical protein